MDDNILESWTDEADGVLTITLSGDLGLASCDYLSPLRGRISSVPWRAVEIDLRRLSYIDSTGLIQIIRLHRVARVLRIPFTVHVDEGTLACRVLKLIGAEDLFPVQTHARPLSGAVAQAASA